MNIKHAFIASSAFSVLCGISNDVADSVPGEMQLLLGYRHEKQQGIDTQVGKIWKDGGVTISYDIGSMAGNYTKSQQKEQILWHKEQVAHGRQVHVALAKDMTLYVTFPESSANFYAKIKSEADIVDILLMVLTYSPSQTKTGKGCQD